MQIWIYSILGVFIASIASLLGVFVLLTKKDKIALVVPYLVSLAAGALFGDAFFHLIPDSLDRMGDSTFVSLLVLCGIILFFVLEQFIRWRHCHAPVTDKHVHPMVAMNIVGDGLHNFIDGVVIGASFMISIPVGIATTIAVFLHEIPQEIGDFGVMIGGGLKIGRALYIHVLLGFVAVGGTILSLIIGPMLKGFSESVLPIVAGGFIYVAGSDLVPEIHGGCDGRSSVSILQLSFLVLGIVLMLLMKLIG